jgi:GR25 family glycosyltransferase involved in LPS biosynthesis
MAKQINTYFDKIFYINLEKDVDRNASMIAQFEKFGITNYERFNAFRSGELPNEHAYRNFIDKEHRYVLNSLACRESHLSVIKIAKEREYNRILILEDDVEFQVDPNEILGINIDISNDWDMLYFGGLVEHYFRNQIVCAHAYAVNSKMYDDIINMCTASGMEIDNFYAKILHHMSYNYNQSGKYNIRMTIPFDTIKQNKSFISNIR